MVPDEASSGPSALSHAGGRMLHELRQEPSPAVVA
jgi:hypothetical protein